MQSGPEQLKDWMRRRGFTQADAARYLEVDEPYVSVLSSGKRTPGLANAIRLERLTGIPVEAWASNALDEPEEPVAAGGRKRPHSQDAKAHGR
jgi:transcriptional regulator with XRE-family HTH domain